MIVGRYSAFVPLPILVAVVGEMLQELKNE